MQRVVGRKSILRRHRYFAGISFALVARRAEVSRHWQCVLVRDGGLTVTLDDLSELAEQWMGCAAE